MIPSSLELPTRWLRVKEIIEQSGNAIALRWQYGKIGLMQQSCSILWQKHGSANTKTCLMQPFCADRPHLESMCITMQDEKMLPIDIPMIWDGIPLR